MYDTGDEQSQFNMRWDEMPGWSIIGRDITFSGVVDVVAYVELSVQKHKYVYKNHDSASDLIC